MTFWRLAGADRGEPAMYDEATGRATTYGALAAAADRIGDAFGRDRKRLVLLFCDNGSSGIAALTAALRAGHAVFLASPRLAADLRAQLVAVYRPDIVWPAGFAGDGYHVVTAADLGDAAVADQADETPIAPELGVLLSTSGSTGSPKVARLSYGNLQANAAAIAQYLELAGSARPITSLPMHYSYGLSVVTSHLLAGARIVTTTRGVLEADFWRLFREQECTSLAGVPYTYEMLLRLGLATMSLPSLRVLTQAGGRLGTDKIDKLHRLASERGWRFFVMYGQTEATARISYVPWERLGAKVGSVGVPIPGGRLWIEAGGQPVELPGTEGEIVYAGPNVMLGYADSRAGLAGGDELGGTLHTGDIGYRDAEGFFFVTGRRKRFLKMFGVRVNLDDVERFLEAKLGCAVAGVGEDDRMLVVLEHPDPAKPEEARRLITGTYGIPVSGVRVTSAAQLPRTSAGKKDYPLVSGNLTNAAPR